MRKCPPGTCSANVSNNKRVMNPIEAFGVGLNYTVTVNHHVLNDQNELTFSFAA